MLFDKSITVAGLHLRIVGFILIQRVDTDATWDYGMNQSSWCSVDRQQAYLIVVMTSKLLALMNSNRNMHFFVICIDLFTYLNITDGKVCVHCRLYVLWTDANVRHVYFIYKNLFAKTRTPYLYLTPYLYRTCTVPVY